MRSRVDSSSGPSTCSRGRAVGGSVSPPPTTSSSAAVPTGDGGAVFEVRGPMAPVVPQTGSSGQPTSGARPPPAPMARRSGVAGLERLGQLVLRHLRAPGDVRLLGPLVQLVLRRLRALTAASATSARLDLLLELLGIERGDLVTRLLAQLREDLLLLFLHVVPDAALEHLDRGAEARLRDQLRQLVESLTRELVLVLRFLLRLLTERALHDRVQ